MTAARDQLPAKRSTRLPAIAVALILAALMALPVVLATSTMPFTPSDLSAALTGIPSEATAAAAPAATQVPGCRAGQRLAPTPDPPADCGAPRVSADPAAWYDDAPKIVVTGS